MNDAMSINADDSKRRVGSPKLTKMSPSFGSIVVKAVALVTNELVG